MKVGRNPGRVAGLWYLLLVALGPVRLIYIPHKLFVRGDAGATVGNIGAHEWLFRWGIVSDLAAGVVLIFLVMAFYRLFRDVDQNLAVLVVIFGGVLPAMVCFVGVVADGGVLATLHGADYLSVFDKPQRDALAMLLLQLRSQLNFAAEILWGVWLLPLAGLVWKSRFVPRFLAVWLVLNGAAYVVLSLTAELVPQYYSEVFMFAQPAMFGELALVLWLLVKGSRTALVEDSVLSPS